MSSIAGESFRVIAIILVGWSSFAFADAISKDLTTEYHPSIILSFSGLFTGSLLCAWILINKGIKGFLSPNWKWLVARAACIAITATGVVNAVAMIPLADLYGITFAAPFFAVLLSIMFLKENVGWHRWLSVIIGFIGVIVLLGPQFQQLNIGVIYAVAAMLSIAVGTIVIRKIGNDEYLPLFVLYPYLGILCVNMPIATQHIEPIEIADLSWFVGNSLFVLLGQLGITYGIAAAKSTASVAPFVYVQVVWGVLFGVLFFDEIPTSTTIIGLILVVSAGLFMIWREKQLNKSIPTSR